MHNTDKSFSMIRGREVFESDQRKIWRCPRCEWWRDWNTLTCCGCGTPRDGAYFAAPEVRRGAARPKALGAGQ
jgi:hypothetical protein